MLVITLAHRRSIVQVAARIIDNAENEKRYIMEDGKLKVIPGKGSTQLDLAKAVIEYENTVQHLAEQLRQVSDFMDTMTKHANNGASNAENPK